jgi:RNA polymerase sigma factor (sigma-70 family)
MTEIEKRELKIDMDKVLAALPDTHRRAALLFMEGYSQAEVGARLGVRQGTISKWMEKFRTSFRELE